MWLIWKRIFFFAKPLSEDPPLGLEIILKTLSSYSWFINTPGEGEIVFYRIFPGVVQNYRTVVLLLAAACLPFRLPGKIWPDKYPLSGQYTTIIGPESSYENISAKNVHQRIFAMDHTAAKPKYLSRKRKLLPPKIRKWTFGTLSLILETARKIRKYI